MKALIEEFKQFILRGNVVDMAVGVVVGNSFKEISTSLVNDIIMPTIGMLLGKVEFSELKIVLQQASLAADGTEIAEVAIRYGAFIQTIVDFLIVAAAVFVMIKVFAMLSNLRKKQEEVVEEVVVEEAPKPTSEELLAEIVDLLKAK